MPLLQNAKKALRSSRRKAIINSRIRSILKTMTDKMRKEPTEKNLSDAFSSIDKAVKRNLMHKNKAGRMKSQLSKLVVETKAPKAKKAVAKKSVKKVAKKTAKKAVKKSTKAKSSTSKK